MPTWSRAPAALRSILRTAVGMPRSVVLFDPNTDLAVLYSPGSTFARW